jgi:hypothetical protein
MDCIEELNQIDGRDSMLFSEVVLWSYRITVDVIHWMAYLRSSGKHQESGKSTWN